MHDAILYIFFSEVLHKDRHALPHHTHTNTHARRHARTYATVQPHAQGTQRYLSFRLAWRHTNEIQEQLPLRHRSEDVKCC